MRRILLVAVALVGAWFAFGFLRNALSSPETRIRRRFAELSEGFDDARMRPVIRLFADGYRDEGSGLVRDEVKEVLVYLYFRELDPETKAFRFRVEIPDESIVVNVSEEDSSRADVRLRAHFERLTRGEWEPFWDASVSAEMEEGADGWQFVRTFDVNHRERGRLR